MLDPLRLSKSIDQINNRTLPQLDQMIEQRIEQFNQGIAANVEDLMRLIERLESALARLNGANIRLQIPAAQQEKEHSK